MAEGDVLVLVLGLFGIVTLIGIFSAAAARLGQLDRRHRTDHR
jgi:hypothetical protein